MVRRRALALRPINSVKNIVDSTNLGVAAATNTDVTVGSPVYAFTGAVTDIPIGAKVSRIYLFVQIQQQSVNSNVDWYFAKGPQDVFNTRPVPGSTGGSVQRKFILHEEKGIPGPMNNGSPPLTFRGVIKIPRGRQRFAEGDKMWIRARGAAVYDMCVKCIYKFYQ